MNRLIIPILAVIMTAFLLSGCIKDRLADGYQFGDISKGIADDALAILEARNKYCDQNQDNAVRNMALSLIRVRFAWIPANGICSQLPTSVDGIAAQLAEKP